MLRAGASTCIGLGNARTQGVCVVPKPQRKQDVIANDGLPNEYNRHYMLCIQHLDANCGLERYIRLCIFKNKSQRDRALAGCECCAMISAMGVFMPPVSSSRCGFRASSRGGEKPNVLRRRRTTDAVFFCDKNSDSILS
jgi:hypothetical protein